MKKKSIKKVLMCNPLYFSELDYVINPWMKPGTIDEDTVMKQWERLVHVYKELGIEVQVIDQVHGVPDMVFATDQGIVHQNKVLMSRFWYEQRKPETQYYERWFGEQGYELQYLPSGTYFEGNGDAYFWGDTLLVGVGFRADEYTCKSVSEILDVEVVPVEIIDPKFYHLDVGFLPLNEDTAFYYPQGYTKKSREVLEKLIPNLIPFTRHEISHFAANSVVTGNTVICQQGSPTFEDKIHKLGYNTVSVDVSEFIKSGGGIHCLTNILEYK